MPDPTPGSLVTTKYHTTDGKVFDNLEDAEVHQSKTVNREALLNFVERFAKSGTPTTGTDGRFFLVPFFKDLCEDEGSAERLIALLQKAIY